MRWAPPGYALTLTFAVTAPLLAPGYLLIRDAVSTPRSYLSDSALGLGEAAPRAVPQDFAVATLSAIIDGGVIVKAVLMAALFLAGWGAARLAAQLLPDAGLPGQLVATTVAIWNPYVAERLLQGHWSLLLAYGCLPWVARAVVRLRTGPADLSVWASAMFWIALAGLTPTGVILAVIVALVCIAVPGNGIARIRCGAAVLVVAVLAASPWLTASALGDALGSSQSSGLAPFAARAEPGLGTLGSLAGLAGIWNADAVPYSRTTLFALVATAVLLGIVALGLPAVLRRPSVAPLMILAGGTVLTVAAMATGPGVALLQAIVEHVPGMAILRDGQKWAALAMPGYALAGAGAVLTVQRRVRPGVSAVVFAVAMIAILPDLAWGVGGNLRSVHYPSSWAAVAARINAEPRDVAVLPPDTMRQFEWSGPAPVLDPLPRWVRAEVLSTGDLIVSGRIVAGEGTRAREVQRLLTAGADRTALAAAGVGWVVEYTDDDIVLYRVDGVIPVVPQWKRTTMIAAHLIWSMMIATGALIMGVTAWRRRVQS